MTLTLILLAIGNMLLLMAIRSLRAQRPPARHAPAFAAAGVPVLGPGTWPDGIGWTWRPLGREYQTVLLLAVTTFFLVVNFNLLSIVSVQERRIVCLAQMVAMMAQKLHVGSAGGRDASSALPLERTADKDEEKEVA